jgi:hypothetical protein
MLCAPATVHQLSGMHREVARFAKRRFGATIWLERGSRHILSQE